METTFQFQSRLLSSKKRMGRGRNPLLFLKKMENLTEGRLSQSHNGKITFFPEDFTLLCENLFIAAGLLGVDLGFAVRTKFPNFCPYCYNASCKCKGIQPRPPYKRWNGPIPPENSLTELQEMIVKVYPPDRYPLEYQVKKLLEEIEECREAIQSSALIEVQEELADIFARLAPLAHFLKMPLY